VNTAIPWSLMRHLLAHNGTN